MLSIDDTDFWIVLFLFIAYPCPLKFLFDAQPFIDGIPNFNSLQTLFQVSNKEHRRVAMRTRDKLLIYTLDEWKPERTLRMMNRCLQFGCRPQKANIKTPCYPPTSTERHKIVAKYFTKAHAASASCPVPASGTWFHHTAARFFSKVTRAEVRCSGCPLVSTHIVAGVPLAMWRGRKPVENCARVVSVGWEPIRCHCRASEGLSLLLC